MRTARVATIRRRRSGSLAALAAFGPLLAAGVVVTAVWGMRAGLAMLLVGFAIQSALGRIGRTGRQTTEVGDDAAETDETLAKLADANTRAALAQLPPGFTVLTNLNCPTVNVDHVVVGPSGVWAMETQADPGFVEERAGSVWLNGSPMYRDPRRQARAAAAAVADLLERETGARWWVEGLVFFPNATVQMGRSQSASRIVGSPQLLSRLHLAAAPLDTDEQSRLLQALSEAKVRSAARGVYEPRARSAA
jgi:hypothetical protein